MRATVRKKAKEEDLHVRRLVQSLEELDYLHEHRFMLNRKAALPVAAEKFATAQKWLQRSRIRSQLNVVA